FASRHAATRLSRTAVSPACAASLVCMSVQTAQPLIWLARINTRFWVAVGRVDGDPTTAPAELMCLTNFCRISLPLKSRRASMVLSLAVLFWYTKNGLHLKDTAGLNNVTCSRCPDPDGGKALGAAPHQVKSAGAGRRFPCGRHVRSPVRTAGIRNGQLADRAAIIRSVAAGLRVPHLEHGCAWQRAGCPFTGCRELVSGD